MPHPPSPVRLLSSAPRAHLFTRALFHSRPPLRGISTSLALRSDTKDPSPSTFRFGGPAPPRLPKEDQELFEALQRASTGAFSTPRTPPHINQSPDSAADEIQHARERVEDRAAEDPAQAKGQDEFERTIEARGEGEELHPNVVRGAQPEFEGDVNPRTGEVGGPKNEPLRWGAQGEWTYNGRTTDF